MKIKNIFSLVLSIMVILMCMPITSYADYTRIYPQEEIFNNDNCGMFNFDNFKILECTDINSVYEFNYDTAVEKSAPLIVYYTSADNELDISINFHGENPYSRNYNNNTYISFTIPDFYNSLDSNVEVSKAEDTDDYTFTFNEDNSCTIVSKIPTSCGYNNVLAFMVLRAIDTTSYRIDTTGDIQYLYPKTKIMLLGEDYYIKANYNASFIKTGRVLGDLCYADNGELITKTFISYGITRDLFIEATITGTETIDIDTNREILLANVVNDGHWFINSMIFEPLKRTTNTMWTTSSMNLYATGSHIEKDKPLGKILFRFIPDDTLPTETTLSIGDAVINIQHTEYSFMNMKSDGFPDLSFDCEFDTYGDRIDYSSHFLNPLLEAHTSCRSEDSNPSESINTSIVESTKKVYPYTKGLPRVMHNGQEGTFTTRIYETTVNLVPETPVDFIFDYKYENNTLTLSANDCYKQPNKSYYFGNSHYYCLDNAIMYNKKFKSYTSSYFGYNKFFFTESSNDDVPDITDNSIPQSTDSTSIGYQFVISSNQVQEKPTFEVEFNENNDKVITLFGQEVLLSNTKYKEEANKIRTVLDYDNNNDGVLNAMDAANVLVLAAEVGSGINIVTEENIKNMDINLDGKVNAIDASDILIISAMLGAGYVVTNIDDVIAT